MMEIKALFLFYFICLILTITKAYITTFTENTEPKILDIMDIKALKYDLYIKTTEADYTSTATNLSFKGSVCITVEFEKPFTEFLQVILNIAETTEIFNITIRNQNSTISDFSHKMNSSHLILNSEEKLNINSTLKILIFFKNFYGNDMYGFYRSYYSDENNKTRWLLTTQLEANYARKVFPCFDKPSWKAKFEVTIEIPDSMSDYTVFSNTPAKKITKKGTKVFNFQETALKMSPYILAFTVSDFNCTNKDYFESKYSSEQSKKYILTCGRSEIIKNNEGELSQKIAKEAVEILNKYLNFSYGFEKIHQIGIPDFSAGAMENWGHISYRETKLFFNKKKDSSLTKQNIILVIAHELVHQWFGNLVTPQSWDYIWLNEAFATYLSYKVADEINEPKKEKWQYKEQFLVDEIHLKAFETDGFASSTPLSNKIVNENLVMSYFNDIPYSKGAAVLRMWEQFLGDDDFKKSLQKYVKENAEKTVNCSHLYKAFNEPHTFPENFFKSWHEQSGYPVVEVKKLEKNNYSLSQHRFLWEKSEENFSTTWVLPISFFTNDNKVIKGKSYLMDKNEIILENITFKWFVLNNNREGYYRVNYEKEHWEALGNALRKNFSIISECNRAQLVNDVFSLARSIYKNYIDYGTALAFTEFLKNDSSLIVWKTALESFKFIQLKLAGNVELSDKFKSYVLKLLIPHFKNLTHNEKLHTQKLLSTHINQWACSLDFKNCTAEAEIIYNKNELRPDMEETIICTVIRNNNSYWNKIFEKYKEETKSAKKLMYLSALGCTNDNNTAELFLNKTLKTSEIRQQDRLHLFLSVCENIKNIEVAFKFIENNYEIIVNSYGGINVLGKVLKTLSQKMHKKKDLERFKKLAENVNGLVPKESIQSAIQTLSSNVKWADEKLSEIKKYLNTGFHSTISLSLLLLCSLIIYNM